MNETLINKYQKTGLELSLCDFGSWEFGLDNNYQYYYIYLNVPDESNPILENESECFIASGIEQNEVFGIPMFEYLKSYYLDKDCVYFTNKKDLYKALTIVKRILNDLKIDFSIVENFWG